MITIVRSIVTSTVVGVLLLAPVSASAEKTRISMVDGQWHLNGRVTYTGTQAEGLLMNVRMVNAVFEDKARSGFDAEENTSEFTAKIPEYVAHGIRAFTINLQGGFPGYEGAINSVFNPDGSLRKSYLRRVKRIIEACDRNGAAVILGCYYQRQDQILRDEKAVRTGVANTVRWLAKSGYTNVILEIANEFNHSGFNHPILKKSQGQVELIRLAKETWPKLLVSTSGLGNGRLPDNVARVSDFLLIHFNGTKLDDIPKRIQALKKYGKPIICNEDQKYGEQAAEAARLSVEHGASWGFMHEKINQHFPFLFKGADDDLKVYKMLKKLTTPISAETYFPQPESNGGWRKLTDSEQVRTIAGMDSEKLIFEPGTDLEYSTHGLYHAALVCEVVTGMSYDRFTIEYLFKPLGIEKWWFEQMPLILLRSYPARAVFNISFRATGVFYRGTSLVPPMSRP